MPTKRTISTIREQVYQILRDEICSGEFAPGTRLQEIELAEHLNVSRSPIREALRQLTADGLLIDIPNKGVYVKEFTVKDIKEIFDLRVMLESYSIYHSVGHITSARLERLLKILDELEKSFASDDLKTYTSTDEKLHVEIVHLADNSLINEIYERVRSMNQQFRILSLMDHKRFKESLDEHRTIIESLTSGDIETANKVNRYHLELARDAIIERLENIQTSKQ